jgi:hypothetical protein
MDYVMNATAKMLNMTPFRCTIGVESQAGLVFHGQSTVEGNCDHMKDFMRTLRQALSNPANILASDGYYRCKFGEGVVQLSPVQNRHTYPYDLLVAEMQVQNPNGDWFYPYRVTFYFDR